MAKIAKSEEELKRIALKRFLENANLTPAEAARMAGYSNSNQLYNYFSGRTRSLSVSTIERLDKVIPGVAGAVLSVTGGSFEDVGVRSVAVRMAAQAGKMRSSSELPNHEWIEIPVPIDNTQRAAGAFGCVVRSPGFEEVYPPGTVVVCMPAGRHERGISSGDQVVLERLHGRHVEVTVRQLVVDGGKAYLIPRTKEPAYQAPITMPWPSDGTRMWKVGDDRYSIAGVAIGAWISFD